MKWTPALKAHQQAAGFGHFSGVILDDIFGFKRAMDFVNGDSALEHPLNGVGSIEDFGHGRIITLIYLGSRNQRFSAVP
jgi:hypothetical protein